MSVGGWNEGVIYLYFEEFFFYFKIKIYSFNNKSGNFNSIVSSDATRTTFCQSAIDVARKNNLDGLDIDWFVKLLF